ncbi:hypothetical protein [Tabrizicola soli]|uniref:EF-hand domain-containing protein n=1 Tax=Tabrizicola soli TaxID=2185115 RepID=A0ABV7DYD3_9RHOB|nr:hypothetical protein [Tabrizicola soli]
MVRIMAALALAMLFAAQGAFAEDGGDPLAEAMERNPERLAARLVDLVAGFGGPAGLTAAGIEEHIALERAAARASALRRLWAMDLDGDGTVLRAELSVSQRAASARARGRMERQFAAADLNRDGTLDGAEMAAEGQAAALAALDEGEAALLRASLRLDGDGDGALTAVEVRAALARLDQEA